MASPPPAAHGPDVYPKDLNPQIHGMRGLATAFVFVYHLYGVGTLWGFWPKTLDPLAPVLIVGLHGVDLFFVISGYLITASLLRHRDAGRFLLDRCIRIYPVFLAIHLLVFGIGPLIGYRFMAGTSLENWTLDFISNALLLPGIFDLPLAQLNAWSLSYEAAFYLLSAAIYIAACIFGRRIAGLALALLLIPVLHIYPRAVFFLAGIAVFFVVERGFRTAPRIVRLLSLPALLLALAGMRWGENHPFYGLLAFLPTFLFFFSIVEGRCLLSSMLRRRPLQYLATISYSFYLWSPFVTYPMKLFIERYLLGRLDVGLIFALFAALGLAASLLAAHLSYLVLEERAGRYLRGRLRKARALAATA